MISSREEHEREQSQNPWDVPTLRGLAKAERVKEPKQEKTDCGLKI